ncbi:hypothetical protein HG531_004922 [Fusarium graminearum]|nr:hypothetical protein HG531_004922 [Fusarium graminearum]
MLSAVLEHRVESPEVRKMMRGDEDSSRRGTNVAVKTWVPDTLLAKRTRVVDQNINPAKLGLDSLKDQRDLVVIAKVDLHNIYTALGVRKFAFQLGDCCFSVGGFARAENDMVGL